MKITTIKNETNRNQCVSNPRASEILATVDRNVKWYSHHGKCCGISINIIDTEAGGSQVQDLPKSLSNTLSQNRM